MAVEIVVDEYLDQLREVEASKPIHRRRHIPEAKDIAEAAGVSLSFYYKWAGNRTTNINRKLLDTIISLLRDCGFDTTFNDIFAHTSDRG